MICLLLFFASIILPTGLAYMLLLPEASGQKVYEKNGATIDASNADQGYIMVKRKSSKKQVVRVALGKTTYEYRITGEGDYHVLPLQMGSGTYTVEVFEQTSGTKYSKKYAKEIKASMSDENSCYLYPNMYVDYDNNTAAIALSNQLCEGLTDDKEKYSAIYGYIKKNIGYDFLTAMGVTGNKIKEYIPDLDGVLGKGMGICFDYSALACCMLRAQGVPTKMVHGYAGKEYHAWNEIYINGKWARFDATFAVAGKKVESSEYVAQGYY